LKENALKRTQKMRAVASAMALLIVLVAGPMMVLVGGHASSHGQHTKHHPQQHATQHASLACNLMCTVFSVSHGAGPAVSQNPFLLIATVEVQAESVFSTPLLSLSQPRAPPV
jgi:hypothetical protein